MKRHFCARTGGRLSGQCRTFSIDDWSFRTTQSHVMLSACRPQPDSFSGDLIMSAFQRLPDIFSRILAFPANAGHDFESFRCWPETVLRVQVVPARSDTISGISGQHRTRLSVLFRATPNLSGVAIHFPSTGTDTFGQALRPSRMRAMMAGSSLRCGPMPGSDVPCCLRYSEKMSARSRTPAAISGVRPSSLA
jgi:hypothetical protein